eukprot:1182089-Prorocentrum_minimum.AAC.2
MPAASRRKSMRLEELQLLRGDQHREDPPASPAGEAEPASEAERPPSGEAEAAAAVADEAPAEAEQRRSSGKKAPRRSRSVHFMI